MGATPQRNATTESDDLATARIEIKNYARRNGVNAVNAAAYRAGERLIDRNTGQVFDYRKLANRVEHTEIIGPADMPARFKDRETLWTAAEASETYKNARVARDFVLSIPHELTAAQRLELIRGYVSEQLTSERMVADVAWHKPNADNDERNYHAHVLVAQRQMFSNGFRSVKTRTWNTREQLRTWRSAWMAHCNAALERAGSAARAENRSLEVQHAEALAAGDVPGALATNREPEPHVPRAVYQRPQAPHHRARYNQKIRAVADHQARMDAFAKSIALIRYKHAERQRLAHVEQRMRDIRQGKAQRAFVQRIAEIRRRHAKPKPPSIFTQARPSKVRLLAGPKKSEQIPRAWILEKLRPLRPLTAFLEILYTDAQLLAELQAARVQQLRARLPQARVRKSAHQRGRGRRRSRAT